jgi:LL-diaminopimelate aminotransferase
VPRLAARFESLPEYPLAHIPRRKRELLARGVDVIDLGAGDADFAPPAAAVEALAKAARDPAMHRYGFALGLVAYREAVSAWMARRFGLEVDRVINLRPPEDATTTYTDYVSLRWARDWPAEDLWVLAKPAAA